MRYTNQTITGTRQQIQTSLGCSLPRNHTESWPEGPWEVVQPEPQSPSPEQVAVQARQRSLAGLAYDCGDGRLIQCRPQDEQNVRNAIELMQRSGVSEMLWRLVDNSHQTVTVGELVAALHYGQEQAAIIWATFFNEVE